MLDSAKGSHAYLIFGRETMLVDTGLSFNGDRIVKELESMNVTLNDIKHILLTHYDLDHIGNASKLAALTGADLWASGVDRPYILGEADRPGFKKYLPYIFHVAKPEVVKPYPDNGKLNEVTVIPTPGHTPGHVCLLFEDILFAGDLVENKGGSLIPYPALWNWNTPMMKKSITDVSGYPFKWVCPAHGRPVERGMLWEMI